jgi:hypothetical protein
LALEAREAFFRRGRNQLVVVKGRRGGIVNAGGHSQDTQSNTCFWEVSEPITSNDPSG